MKLLYLFLSFSITSGLCVKANTFTQEGDSLYKLSTHLFSSNTDSSIKIAQIAYHKYRLAKNTFGQAKSLNAIGFFYYYQSKYDSAENYYNRAIVASEMAKDTLTWSKAIGNLGLIESAKSNYQKAATLLFQSLKIAESLNNPDSSFLAGRYLDAANPLILNSRNREGLELVKKGVEIGEKINNKQILSNGYNSLASIYIHINEYDSAEYYLLKSIEIKQTLNNLLGLAKGYNNLSQLKVDTKDYKNALKYAQKSLKLAIEYGNQYEIANSYNSVGTCYLRLKEDKRAIYPLQEAIKNATEAGAINLKYVAHTNLAKAYYNLKDYKLAYEHYKIYQEHKNKLITEDYNKQITDSRTKYETEKKEAENNQLKIENELKSNEIATKQAEKRTLIISFIALIIFIVALAFFISYKRKIKAQKLLQQEEKLRFKAVIEAEEKERIRIAKELHDGLGQLLSTAKLNVASLEGNVDKEDEILVKNASDLIDNAVKEVRSISHNMMPVALTQLGLISAIKELTNKMNDSGLLNVKFESNIETRLNSSIEISIYRVIQEILNNTIKHAQAKIITILLTKEKERLTLLISDDGVGFNTNEIENSKGIGWKSIFSRIAMLNGDINVDSSKDKGTNLLVSIPINE
ncbi:MAG: tetratricopeptide repeat protein [Flavobacteriales bacterium]|nr:tetratricopeptide repeat protein [Flavobacteriales bacterium]MCB9363788.1 tetratricopeptide repeat protein [Flavobacteriales bacterium]